jgi:translation initiation factor 1
VKKSKSPDTKGPGEHDSKKNVFTSPFASLAALKDSLPPGKSAETLLHEKPPAKAVVRIERAGRGGKEVTLVDQLDLPVDLRETWLDALKAKLGCGGHLEGGCLVFQGDHRERLPSLLKKRGVSLVVLGN